MNDILNIIMTSKLNTCCLALAGRRRRPSLQPDPRRISRQPIPKNIRYGIVLI